MQLLLWLASFEKVRKDELTGFLEIVIQDRGRLREITQALDTLIHDGKIELLAYQKMRLGRDTSYDIGTAVTTTAMFGIPPWQLIGFLRNQGIRDPAISEFALEIESQRSKGKLDVNDAGMVSLPYGKMETQHAQVYS